MNESDAGAGLRLQLLQPHRHHAATSPSSRSISTPWRWANSIRLRDRPSGAKSASPPASSKSDCPTGQLSKPDRNAAKWPNVGPSGATKKRSRREADDAGNGLSSRRRSSTRSAGWCDDDAILPVDVGNNTYSFGRYFEVQAPGRIDERATWAPSAFPCPRPWVPGRPPRRATAPLPAARSCRFQRRRRVWAIHGMRADHPGQVRHEHHPRAARQQRAGQDLQGTAGRRVGRVADVAAQPRLRRLRRPVRREGASAVDTPRRARRGHRRRRWPTTARPSWPCTSDALLV